MNYEDLGRELTFKDFLLGEYLIKDIDMPTLLRWMQSGELTAGQYNSVQYEVLKRKGLNCA